MPQLRLELKDTHQIRVSDDAIARYIGLYQTMLAARQQEPARLAEAYKEIEALVLTIDGLQPEKGHETLYVVRELTSKRVWFAEPLLQCGAGGAPGGRPGASVGGALGQAGAGVDVGQAGCVRQGHRHRVSGDPPPLLPKPLYARFGQASARHDSQAKVTMRSKVRGLRPSTRVLEERRQAAASASPPPPAPPQGAATSTAALPASVTPATVAPPEPCASSAGGLLHTDNALEATSVATTEEAAVEVEAGEVVLGYCAAVRGILNDSQGGPLHPPGVRMSEALQEVRDSLDRNLGAQKGGLPSRC